MTVAAKFFSQSVALPTMPEIAHRLLKSFEDESLSLERLAGLVSQDQSLSAKLLRLANSARYSPSREILTIQAAAATIGMTPLRDLALAACVVGAFPASLGFDRLRFWRHGLATAAHARTLAPLADADPDTASLAGMILGAGELLMLMSEPNAVAHAQAAAAAPDSLFECLRLTMGCTHAEVTAELARRWRFPAAMAAGLEAAADPMASRPFSRLGAVIRLASVMADAGARGLPEVDTMLEVQGDLATHLRIDIDMLRRRLQPWAQVTAGVDQLG